MHLHRAGVASTPGWLTLARRRWWAEVCTCVSTFLLRENSRKISLEFHTFWPRENFRILFHALDVDILIPQSMIHDPSRLWNSTIAVILASLCTLWADGGPWQSRRMGRTDVPATGCRSPWGSFWQTWSGNTSTWTLNFPDLLSCLGSPSRCWLSLLCNASLQYCLNTWHWTEARGIIKTVTLHFLVCPELDENLFFLSPGATESTCCRHQTPMRKFRAGGFNPLWGRSRRNEGRFSYLLAKIYACYWSSITFLGEWLTFGISNNTYPKASWCMALFFTSRTLSKRSEEVWEMDGEISALR